MITSTSNRPIINNNNNNNENNNTAKSLYGDMVCILCGIAIIPYLSWEMYQLEPDHPKRTVATYVYVLMLIPPLMFLPAVIYRNVWFSRIGMAAAVSFNAVLNLVEWPHQGECTITSCFQGGVMMGVLANVSLSFQEKLIRLAIFFLVGSYVSIQSPHSVYMEDTLPILGGTILLAIFILYVHNFGVTKELATVQAARLVLAALFVYHSIVNLASISSSSNSAYEHISSMMKAGGLACIGIAATGTFQNEIILKKQLEVLVEERTREIQTQNQKLHMVNMALQASETAIAITDNSGCIIWINTAFEQLCHKTEEVLASLPLKDVIYKLDTTKKENKYKVMETLEYYDDDATTTKPPSREDELEIGGSAFRLEATPFQVSNKTCENNNTAAKETRSNINGRFLMVFKDITSGRARESAEKKAQEEAMMAKAMGESMVTLTHELRTPLQGIMGVTSLLLQQASDLNSDVLESLKLIMASSSLLLNLINNLLDVKRATAKMMEDFPVASIPASGPIKDAIGFCQPLASISNVSIVADLNTAKNAIIKSNALRLQQVLINLISNGIKYTKQGSEICVRIRTSTMGDVRQRIKDALASSSSQQNDAEEEATLRDYDGDENAGGDYHQEPVLVFTVADCGPGVAMDQAERLFRRFARLDTKPTRTLGNNKIGQPSGTGLGLHLCLLFVERMKGQLWVTNNNNDSDNNAGNGGGSSFSFYLPLVSNIDYDAIADHHDGKALKTAATAKRDKSPHSIISRNNNKQGRSKEQNDNNVPVSVFDRRVLLVDDTLINRKVFDRMLKRIGVSNSVTVESGKKALEELSMNQYDLVITDLQMPGMSGTELSLAINKMFVEEERVVGEPSSSSIVVVGLTADTGIDVAERCAASGMADVLYKPLTVAEMRDYFETTIPRLEAGVWYSDAYNARNGSTPPQ